MAVTTKQAALDNLKAIGTLILQSPDAQIQEIVNKVGDQLQQLRQVDQLQNDQLTTLDSEIVTIKATLNSLPQLGDEETQRVLELIANNMPEVAQLTLPKVTYRGHEYTLAEFVNMVSVQEGKKPISYSEATYTPEGYLSSVLVRYDDSSEETVTLAYTETADGKTAIYVGQTPHAGGPVDAFEWHVTISHIQSPLLQLDVKRHTDMTLMRLVGTSHLINWNSSPGEGSELGDAGAGEPGDVGTGEPGDVGTGEPGDVGTGEPGDVGTGEPGDVGTGEPGDVGAGEPGDVSNEIQDTPLSPLAGGFSTTSNHSVDALGGGFVNITVPNTGLYRVALVNAVAASTYAVSAAGNPLGSLTADAVGSAAGVISLQSGNVVSVMTAATGTPFSVGVTELDQGLGTANL